MSSPGGRARLNISLRGLCRFLAARVATTARRCVTLPDLPDAAEFAALRSWHAGLSTREAVERYLGKRLASGQFSRGVVGRMRRQLTAFARRRQSGDLAVLFEIQAAGRVKQGHTDKAIELLSTLPLPASLF